MLQWFIRFTEFAEFTEFLFNLGKTPLTHVVSSTLVCVDCKDRISLQFLDVSLIYKFYWILWLRSTLVISCNFMRQGLEARDIFIPSTTEIRCNLDAILD